MEIGAKQAITQTVYIAWMRPAGTDIQGECLTSPRVGTFLRYSCRDAYKDQTWQALSYYEQKASLTEHHYSTETRAPSDCPIPEVVCFHSTPGQTAIACVVAIGFDESPAHNLAHREMMSPLVFQACHCLCYLKVVAL